MSPLLDELPGLVELDDAFVRSGAVPVGDEVSPLGATTTSEGALKCFSSFPLWPGVPSVIRSFPFLSNFCTVCPTVEPLPRPSPSTASVTQTFSCESTWMPCGKANIPLPKENSRLPFVSNFRMGLRSEPTQVFEPQRSIAHTVFPSGAISTPAVEPHCRPLGSFAQLNTDLYGLGSLLTGSICAELVWAAYAPAIPNAAATATAPIHLIRLSSIHGLLDTHFRLLNSFTPAGARRQG
jgi:hypothetical protein